MSDWEAFSLALIADLQTNVPALAGEVMVHPLLSYDPEELSADGDRHLSVFPIGDQAQRAEPLTTAGNELIEVYRVLYWEGAGDETIRGVGDFEAAQALFDLAQAVKDRIHTTAIQTLSGAYRVAYIGAAFPERSGLVRWFAIGVQAHRAQDIT